MVFEILFVAIMLMAAASDVVTYKIPNALVLGLIALFLVDVAVNKFALPWQDYLNHLGGGLLCLMVGFGLSSTRIMGAGDAKLFAAIALWSGFYSLVWLLLYVSLSGFGVMLIIVAARYIVSILQKKQLAFTSGPLPRVLVMREGVPYGAGIGLGSALMMYQQHFPAWLWGW